MTDTEPATISVGHLEATAGDDAGLVDWLARLINDVYAVAEKGLWRDGATRTTASELAGLIAAGEIAVATRDSVRIVTSPRTRAVRDAGRRPDRRGIGIGRDLVEFAERQSRDRGLRAMQLELLVPRRRHPNKEFLKAWYGRRGYQLIGVGSFEDAHPHLAPLLATACDLTVYEKPLGSGTG